MSRFIVNAATARCACGDCDWVGGVSDIGKTLTECHGLGVRLDPGSEVPVGDCPECGSFAYLVDSPGVQTS